MTPRIADAATSERSVNRATVFGLSRRYVAPSQFQVSLSPLTPADDPLGEPAGCLAHADSGLDPTDPDSIKGELAILTWTMMALDVLHPTAFLAVPVTPEVVLAPPFGRTVRELECDRLMLVFENARMGRRRAVLDEAVDAARRFGIRLAVHGNRVNSAAGFDAVLVKPTSSSVEPPVTDTEMVIAVDLRTDDDVEWALATGAHLLEGSALVDPMKVAPVDLRRLNRPH